MHGNEIVFIDSGECHSSGQAINTCTKWADQINFLDLLSATTDFVHRIVSMHNHAEVPRRRQVIIHTPIADSDARTA